MNTMKKTTTTLAAAVLAVALAATGCGGMEEELDQPGNLVQEAKRKPKKKTCVSNSDCPANKFCDFFVGCGIPPVPKGYCKRMPTTCPAFSVKTVCGCNGASYSSACFAQSQGVDVSHQQPCNTSCANLNGTCGGTIGCPDFSTYSVGTKDCPDDRHCCVPIP